ncbi:hypothetical protein [Agromyces mangrovi Wang et al. 2018]|uniref:hypothetical protein n=1 Tax=Agromyces mangrovi TaxID=1858653 RepID=UPI0025722E9A|nr:hypothetical protein [Agromyces mangrovi]BDZ63568.1 hypothetical protein GCM10025877_05060 [Agromyces mangrovi]
MAVGGMQQAMGGEALEAATGRDWDGWFAVLDAAGAASWTHPATVKWLVAEHGVDPWWTQGIVVGYQQARGIRQPGQRQDGTFEASVSKTLPFETDAALDAAIAVVTAELGRAPDAENRTAKHPNARWALDDGEKLAAQATPGGAKTSVTLTWSRMADGERFAEVKEQLRAWLARAAG